MRPTRQPHVLLLPHVLLHIVSRRMNLSEIPLVLVPFKDPHEPFVVRVGREQVGEGPGPLDLHRLCDLLEHARPVDPSPGLEAYAGEDDIRV